MHFQGCNVYCGSKRICLEEIDSSKKDCFSISNVGIKWNMYISYSLRPVNFHAHFQFGKSPSLNRISIISQPNAATTENAAGSLTAPTVSQRVRKLSVNLFSRKKESGQESYPRISQQKFSNWFRNWSGTRANSEKPEHQIQAVIFQWPLQEGNGAQIVFQFGGSDLEDEDEKKTKQDSEEGQGEMH